MKRQHILWAILGVSLAVYLCAYGFLLTGGSGKHTLETISGDPSVLKPYEIAFSLADNRVNQRFTLRSGKVSQSDAYADAEGFHWEHTVMRRHFSESSYFYCRYYWDQTDYRVICAVEEEDLIGRLPGVYLPGGNLESWTPVFTVQKEEEIEGFWALEEALYCAVRKGEQIELRQYSLGGELLKNYPVDFAEAGYFALCHDPVFHGREDYSYVDYSMLNYPPEMDGAQIFELDGEKILVIGAWVQEEASGVDLYVCEPGKLLFHGRIGTDVWKDWYGSQYTYGGEDYPTAKEPFRYFTMPEVVL